MHRFAVIVSLFFLIAPAKFAAAQLNKADIEAEISTASRALHEAFVVGDADKIRSLTTADHVAVTAYYGGPQSLDDVIASLPDLDYRQTIVDGPTIVLLSADVALRTFIADWEGNFKDESLSGRVFVSETLVKQDGRWLERFYQATTIKH